MISNTDPATLSKHQKKKLYCVSVEIPEEIAICKLDKNDRYLICFARFDGENFESLTPSKCDHDYTMGLANYRGAPFVTGSYSNSDCFVRTEVYNFKTDQWNDAPNYPYGS